MKNKEQNTEITFKEMSDWEQKKLLAERINALEKHINEIYTYIYVTEEAKSIVRDIEKKYRKENPDIPW